MDVASENHVEPGGTSTRLWFAAALLPAGWADGVRLTVSDGIIATVERGVARQPADAGGQVAIPGIANVHSHAFQRGMAGLAEVRGPAADSFWTWREIMYRFLERISPDDLEAIAAMAYVEMLETGFTRVGEFHYVHHDPRGARYANASEMTERICGAAANTGIGLTLLPCFYAHGGFGGLPPSPGQRRFVTSLDEFAAIFEAGSRAVAARPGDTIGVAPHSLRAVTPAELRELLTLCPARPLHLHVAEQQQEVADCLAATGARPVEWLLANAPVDRRWCLIHATHMTPAEAAGLARSGATVGLCPLTEANLGDGIFPATEFLAHGGHLGIGSDSNIHIGAPAELCALEYSQRLATLGRNVLAEREGVSTGRSLFERAVSGGHRALGEPPGGLAPGCPADIVELACEPQSLTAREQGDPILDRWIFGGRAGPAIDRVWVRGELLVADGQHWNRAEISAAFRSTLRRVLSD